MLFKVISDRPFSLDGVGPARYKQGELMEINNSDVAEFLIRNEIAEVFEPPNGEELDQLTEEIDPSEPPKDETPIAIIEANAFEDKALLDVYAEEEHGIKLDRRKGLEKMKAEFAELYEDKIAAVNKHNEG